VRKIEEFEQVALLGWTAPDGIYVPE
jgi:hypothetical protein